MDHDGSPHNVLHSSSFKCQNYYKCFRDETLLYMYVVSLSSCLYGLSLSQSKIVFAHSGQSAEAPLVESSPASISNTIVFPLCVLFLSIFLSRLVMHSSKFASSCALVLFRFFCTQVLAWPADCQNLNLQLSLTHLMTCTLVLVPGVLSYLKTEDR